MTDGKKLAYLSEKYFSGTISSAEEKSLYSLISSSKDNAATFRLLEKDWQRRERYRPRTEMSLARLDKRISARERSARYRRTAWISAAAALALTVTVGFLAGRTAQDKSYIVEAPAGGRARTVLPDGSEVWLNACSRLTVSDRFSEKERLVKLEGEGYFNVTRNGKSLFTVEAGDTKTIVKGTKFNLSAYPEAQNVRLSVEEGLVAFVFCGEEKDVSQRQSLEYDKSRQRAAIREESGEGDSSWLDGHMQYEDITLEELMERISRKYSIPVAFGSDMHKHDKFNVSFRNNESLEEIVQSLKLILRRDISFSGEEIQIK